MIRIQTVYFRSVEDMNNWLENFDGKINDIKMTSTNTSTHFLVIYEKRFQEYR